MSTGFEGKSDLTTPPVENSVDKRFTAGLNQHLGRVNLRGDTTGPVGRYDWVALYNKQPPSDPNSGYVDWFWVTDKTSMLTNRAGAVVTTPHISRGITGLAVMSTL